jgi:hypothetical protein
MPTPKQAANFTCATTQGYSVVQGPGSALLLSGFSHWCKTNKRPYVYVWHRRSRATVLVDLTTLSDDTGSHPLSRATIRAMRAAFRHQVGPAVALVTGPFLLSCRMVPVEQAEALAAELVRLYHQSAYWAALQVGSPFVPHDAPQPPANPPPKHPHFAQ